jgi:hypothetical protein
MDILRLKLEELGVRIGCDNTPALEIKIDRILGGSGGNIETFRSLRESPGFGQIEQTNPETLPAIGAADMQEL